MATVVATDIKVHDIIRVANSSDFVRQNNFTEVHALVREIATVSDSKDINRFVVFEIAEDTDKIRSGTQTSKLDNETVGSYGLDPRKNWVILMDPVEVQVDPNKYYANRTGKLGEPDTDRLLGVIHGMGGDNTIKRKGDGPQGFRTRTREAELDASGGFRQKFIGTEAEEEAKLARSERARKYRSRLPNEGVAVDLPLNFAGKVTDLDQRIIDKLITKGIDTLREAKELAETEALTFLIPTTPDALPEITIAKAIEDGYLEADTPGLNFVRDPIVKGKPITTLNELFALTQDNGAGLNIYTGLASKTAKSRGALMQATHEAWEFYRNLSPSTHEANKDIARQIKSAWSSLMTDYQASVRPHIADLEKGGRMIAPERIPEKYIQDGKLVFTFPKISL
jgi:hypothetical protein